MEIGSYQVLFELGRGGMGRVYLGRTVGAGGFERLVAIKRAHPSSSQSEELSQRFLNEARLAGFVHHANVVSMHQAGSDAEGEYLICDYVEGESLAGLTERGRSWGKPPPAVVVRILLDGLAGLHAAHEAVDASGVPLGMLHRDVSMDNLLVGLDGVTRLSDFGIAKSAVSSVVTEQGMLQGKLIYFSPEYLRGLEVDRTIDVYAMGVTLWSALAGALPWKGKEEPQLLHAILLEGIPPLSSAGLEIEPEFDEIIARACRTDPRQRFRTARQMHDALEALAKRTCGIASHVEVAEYVERVMGNELAARRDKIRARRSDLQAPSMIVTQRALEPAVDPDLQATEARLAPVSIEDAFNPIDASTDRVVRAALKRSRRSQQLFYAGVLLVVFAAGYAALALYSDAPSVKRPPTPSRAAPASEFAVPLRLPESAPPQAAGTGQPPEASVPSEAVEPAPAAPPVERVRPRPERAKTRKERGISTKNPYRTE
jgi:serine/threonine-protein kinase